MSQIRPLLPQLVANDGLPAMPAAIAHPEAWAIEPKVDGVRALIVYDDGRLEARNRRGQRREWFRHRPFRDGLLALAERLPIVWRGTVLDGELTTGRFATTMAALQGSARYGPELRLVVFDVPVLAASTCAISTGLPEGSASSSSLAPSRTRSNSHP